jgi:group I intron endonuclease
MHTIYKLYYDNSDKVYIGTTSRKLSARISQHFTELRSERHHSEKLQNAYNKYGLPNFSELATCESAQEAQELEKYWITKYNSFNNGYNHTLGGEGTGQGEDSPTSKHSLEDYLCVLALLAHTNLTAEEISRETSVSVHIVRHISAQRTHAYLQDICPDDYALMISKNRSSDRYCHTYPKVLSPEGKEYEFINANKFCKEHGLKQGNFTQLLNGKAQSCSGWTLANITQPPRIRSRGPYKLLTPTGELIVVDNLSEFARNNGLDSGSLSRLINNKCNSHKGYRKYMEVYESEPAC